MASNGGILNIVAKGQSNEMIMGDISENKSLFSYSYKKHTNFGMQKFRVDYQGQRTLRLTDPSEFTFKIPRYADMWMDTTLCITLPNIWSPIYPPTPDNGNQWSAYDFRWIKDIGHQFIKTVTVSTGGQTLAQYSGSYLSNVVDRDYPMDKKDIINRMTGNTVELNDPSLAWGRDNAYPSAYYRNNVAGSEPSIRGRKLYIPLNFWFGTNPALAFPLIALQYNEVYVRLELRPIQEIFQIRDVFDSTNNFPYIQPDFNTSRFAMYRFLQTPPAVDISVQNANNVYTNTTTTWNADIHLIVTEAFLDTAERLLITQKPHAYLIRDIYEYTFESVTGTSRQKLLNSNGLVTNWMFFLQRNDVNMRNEWSNYTNFPYETLPSNIQQAPYTDTNSNVTSTTIPIQTNLGPLINPDGSNTGFFITGVFSSDNQQQILQTLGILFDGSYRETIFDAGIYNYIEKYTHNPASSKDGLYTYQFDTNSDSRAINPCGGMNMSRFADDGIQLEISTIIPQIDSANAQFQVICDASGNAIGTIKPTYQLYSYSYNMTVYEERFNVLSIISGVCGLLYAR